MKCCAVIYCQPPSSPNPAALPPYLRPIEGLPLAVYALKIYECSEAIDEIIFSIDSDHLLYATENIIGRHRLRKIQKIVAAADSRFATINKALESLPANCDLVFLHEACWPFFDGALIPELITEALTHGAVAIGLQAELPVKRAEQGYILASLDRKRIYIMQSPQVFRVGLIKEAYREARSSSHIFADDAAVVEHYGHKVRVVDGAQSNFRVESELDFRLARMLMKSTSSGRGGHD